MLKIYVHFRFNKYRKLFKFGIVWYTRFNFTNYEKTKEIWRFSQNNSIKNLIKIWVQTTACNETLYNFDSGKVIGRSIALNTGNGQQLSEVMAQSVRATVEVVRKVTGSSPGRYPIPFTFTASIPSVILFSSLFSHRNE